MIAMLLYAASLGVIGLVSYIWLSNYIDLPGWPKRRGGSTGGRSGTTGRAATGETTGAAHAQTPPQLPKRPAELEKARAAEQAKKGENVAAASSPPAASSASSGSKANLLSMAMNAPPALPKRPMLNILHAPTLTKSFSPGPHHGDAPEMVPSPSPASGGNDEQRAAHREQVVWELVASEESYIKGLNILMAVYFNPLKAKAEKGSGKLTKQDFALLFSNIESIWKFHQMLLPALKTAQDGDVSAVLQSHADYLKIYTKYVADYSPALQTMSRLNRNPDFTRFLKRQRDSPSSEGMDIMSFLITPVQRVPRYLLLLKELSRYTPASHPHRASLDRALEKIAKIASHINEQQRQFESASILLELQHQIHFDASEEVQLLQPHRRLMRHGILTIIKQEGTANAAMKADQLGTNMVVMLFNDLLIYTTTDHNYRGQMKLQGCNYQQDNLEIEIVKPKSESYRVPQLLRFQCPSLEEAEKWANSVQEAIKLADDLNQKDAKRKSAANNSISITR